MKLTLMHQLWLDLLILTLACAIMSSIAGNLGTLDSMAAPNPYGGGGQTRLGLPWDPVVIKFRCLRCRCQGLLTRDNLLTYTNGNTIRRVSILHPITANPRVLTPASCTRDCTTRQLDDAVGTVFKNSWWGVDEISRTSQ